MKKTILFFIAILLGFSAAGESGDGLTSSSGYYGTITSARTWTRAYNGGVIYVGQNVANQYDLTIGNLGSLTIEAGVTIIFCTTESDLKISGTGSITAIGNNSNLITFTKLSTIASWGHISFEGSTGNSQLTYCLIQYGKKSGTGTDGYGGGIYISCNNLTISNCSIENNQANEGGGLFVNRCSPHILNSSVNNNTALSTGGGIEFYLNCPSVVENCIIYKNTCSGAGGGGGVFAGYNVGNLLFFNCDIVSNISTNNSSKNIRFYQNTSPPYPKFQNSIIWGSLNSIQYYNSPISSTDFTNCAIQGYTSGYTNCINLNATNNNPAGPNFYVVTAGSEDYRINFISPCRDIGSGSHSLPQDYLGNSRIGAYDVGAYEVQYSRWNGASSNIWGTAANWDGNVDPTSGTGDVIIPSGLSNYPTGDPTAFFIVASGKYMILNPGAKATFNSLTNSGTLKLESDATGISSLIFNNAGIAATVDLYLSGKEQTGINTWHYISSPVTSLNVSIFTSTTQDLAQYVESLPTPDNSGLIEGWIGFDGYNYTSRTTPSPPLYTFNDLAVGQGYDYYYSSNHKYTFSGTLNTSDVPITLAYTGTPDSPLHGFNLIGNPYSSGLNWDDIANELYFPYPSNTSKGLYFTRDNAQCSYVNGVGNPGDVTGIIPPMQGFFVKTYSSGNTITIPAAARSQGTIHSRYKGSTIIPLIRLALTEGTLSDETVVRFDAAAKSDLDYDFDALKMFLSPNTTSIYSSLAGTNYSINGQPFPLTFVEIPIVVNLVSSGNHTISTSQLQGLDTYEVTLTDKSTGFVADLKTTPNLSFSASAGSIPDRFVLKVGTIATGFEKPVVSNNTFNIYPDNNMINIQTISDEWDGKSGSVKVMDLSGKIIDDLNNSEFRKNSLIQIASPGVKGIYVVEMRSGVMRYVGKVVIR